MTTETAVAVTDDEAERARKRALLKAIGLDRLPPEQRELALNIAKRYELDLLLKHLVMIDGRPYITRDGLLHIAHRSGQLDGIVTGEPAIVDEFWRASCSVYRKDMTHPFTYTGRYPTKGGNVKFAPEMAVKVGEVMALRRAFDVAMPTMEERWDQEPPEWEGARDGNPGTTARSRLVRTLGARRGVQDGTTAGAEEEAESVPTEGTTEAPGASEAMNLCGSVGTGLMQGATCTLPFGHAGAHRQGDTGSWPRVPEADPAP